MPKRPQISVRGVTYKRLAERAEALGVAVGKLVDDIITQHLATSYVVRSKKAKR